MSKLFNKLRNNNSNNEDSNKTEIVVKEQPLTIRNFELIACFLDSPDDIYSLAVTCRNACEGCDSNLVWSILTFHIFHEIILDSDDYERQMKNRKSQEDDSPQHLLLPSNETLRFYVGEKKFEQVRKHWYEVVSNAVSKIKNPYSTGGNRVGGGSTGRPFRRRGGGRNNNNINTNETSADAQEEDEQQQTTLQQLYDSINITSGPEKGFYIQYKSCPWRSTPRQASCLHGEKSEKSKLAIEEYIPSIIFDCEAFQQFRLRCLLSLDLCLTLDPIQLGDNASAMKDLATYNNATVSMFFSRRGHRRGGESTNFELFGKQLTELLYYDDASRTKQDNEAVVADPNKKASTSSRNNAALPLSFFTNPRSTDPYWLKNWKANCAATKHIIDYTSLQARCINKVYANVWSSKMVAAWRWRIRQQLNLVRAAQDVLVCPSDHNINRVLNWKVEAAAAGGHSLLKYTMAWRVPFVVLGFSHFVLSFAMKFPLGIVNFILGGVGGSDGENSEQSGGSEDYFPGADYISDQVSNVTNSILNGGANQETFFSSFSDKVIHQSVNSEMGICWQFPTSVFGDASSSSNSKSNNNVLPFSSEVLNNVVSLYFDNVAANTENNTNSNNNNNTAFYILLGAAALSSFFATGYFIGKFPRLEGVPSKYRTLYLRHKLLHDFFSSCSSRLNDFWVFYFVKLFHVVGCVVVIPDAITVAKFTHRWATTIYKVAMWIIKVVWGYFLKHVFSILGFVLSKTSSLFGWIVSFVIKQKEETKTSSMTVETSSSSSQSNEILLYLLENKYLPESANEYITSLSDAFTTYSTSCVSFFNQTSDLGYKIYDTVASATNFILKLPCSSDIMKAACVSTSVAYTIYDVLQKHQHEYNDQFLKRSGAAAYVVKINAATMLDYENAVVLNSNKNKTKKPQSTKKHQRSKWFHMTGDVIFHVSLCLLRWNMYFSMSTAYEKDGFFHAFSHFVKIVGLEFLLRSSSSIFEYLGTAAV